MESWQSRLNESTRPTSHTWFRTSKPQNSFRICRGLNAPDTYSHNAHEICGIYALSRAHTWRSSMGKELHRLPRCRRSTYEKGSAHPPYVAQFLRSHTCKSQRTSWLALRQRNRNPVESFIAEFLSFSTAYIHIYCKLPYIIWRTCGKKSEQFRHFAGIHCWRHRCWYCFGRHSNCHGSRYYSIASANNFINDVHLHLHILWILRARFNFKLISH